MDTDTTITTTVSSDRLGCASRYSRMIQGMLTVCDGAHARDGQGFNATHAGRARMLAGLEPAFWSPEDTREAYVMLRTYKDTQLSGYDWDSLPRYKPSAEDLAEWQRKEERALESQRKKAALERERKEEQRRLHALESRQIDVDASGSFTVRFDYDSELVRAVKACPHGARFERSPRPVWIVTATPNNADVLADMAAAHTFGISELAAQKIAELQAEERAPERLARYDASGSVVRWYFPYTPDVKDRVKALGSRFSPSSNGSQPFWYTSVSADIVRPILEQVERDGFYMDPQEIASLEALVAEAEERLEASRSSTAIVPELEDYRSRDGYRLYPYQQAGVAYALRAKRCFIADVMGLGKTVQALLTAEVAGAFPLVVVCPASVKFNWRKECRQWLPGRSVQVLSGSSEDIDPSAEVYVLNYDIAKHYAGALAEREIEALVLDESHYVKSPKAQRSLACWALALRESYETIRERKSNRRGLAVGSERVPYILLLSGTPLTNRPIELVNQMQLLGTFRALFGSWSKYVYRYCNAYHNGFGLEVKGARVDRLPELNTKLRASCYVRRTEEEARLDLPPLSTVPVALEIDNEAEYRSAADDIARYVGLMAEKKALYAAELQALDGASAAARALQERWDAERRAMQAETLVRMQTLRRLVADGKAAAAISWLTDWLDATEKKIVLFIHHRSTQERVYKELQEHGKKSGYRVARIFGSDGAQTRQDNVEAFQEDEGTRVIVCSLMAAREGITLTASNTVAFLELDWTPGTHLQAERRVLRIGQEESRCFAYYLIAEGTTDEVLATTLAEKRATITAAADGTLLEDGAEDGYGSLLRFLTEQHDAG